MEGLQTLEEIFRTNSNEAKKIETLQHQIKEAKELIKDKSFLDDETKVNETLNDVINIFYKGKENKRQKTVTKDLRKEDKIFKIYSIISARIGALEKYKSQMENDLRGI